MAVVPPMSKVMTRGSSSLAASAAPPTTPAAGPLSMMCAGAAAANSADASPPFDCMSCNGASMPSARSRAASAVT